MAVVEHVADREAFLYECAALVRPGGGLVLATLNRTFRAFAPGIVAAEYVLGWLPRGTHTWSGFVRPSEAARALRRAGLQRLRLLEVGGMEALGEPAADRREQVAGPATPTLSLPPPREAGCSAQLK